MEEQEYKYWYCTECGRQLQDDDFNCQCFKDTVDDDN